MSYYAGLDVSLEETAICIIDETGAIVRAQRSGKPDISVQCRRSVDGADRA